MQTPIVFNFTRKTVTRMGDPALERALREALSAQKGIVMTGPGTAKPATK